MLNIQALLSYPRTKEQQQYAVAVTALVAAAYFWVSYTSSSSGKVKLPQPESTLPILGNTLDVLKKHKDRYYDWLADESTKVNGKPWLFKLIGRPPQIVLTSPALFEDVLKTQADIFVRGEKFSFILYDIFGKGILAVDGDEWVFQRKTASHLFSLQMMRDVMHDVVREKTLVLCQNLAYYAKRSCTFSLNRELSHFTSDVFAKIGFGIDLRCLETGRDGPLSNDFVSAFAFCANVLRYRFQQPYWLWRLKQFLNVGKEKENRRCLEVIDKLIFSIISEYMINNHNIHNVPKKKDLISLFLQSKSKKEISVNGGIDKEMQLIRDLIINFTFAGKDTTSHTLCWFIVMMNRFPRVLEKIRAEIREKLPGLITGEIEIPSMDDLKQLKYLEAVIRENLRLYPTVTQTTRGALASTVLSDGTVVPKGYRVILSMYGAGRQTSIWGHDACEFKPERWLHPTTNELITISPFKFSAFLGGPHMCLGMKFAMLEMKIALAVVLSRFDLKTVEDPWDITYKVSLTYSVKGPMMVHPVPLESQR